MERINKRLCLLLVLALAFGTVTCTENLTYILSGGSTAAFPLYSQFLFGWQVLSPDVDMEYVQSSSIIGINTIIGSNKSTVWVGTELEPTLVQKEIARENGRDLHMFPSALLSVVPFAHYSSLKVSGLKLTGRTLALIWLGNISRWNDPAIVATNPGLASVNQSIMLVVQNGASGTLSIFQNSLIKLLEPGEWPYQQGASWTPEHLAALGNRIVYTNVGNPSTFAKVSLTPYSFGYIIQSLLLELGVPLQAFAIVDPVSNLAIYPNAVALEKSSHSSEFDPTTGIALTNYTLPQDSWPIFGYTYILMDLNFTGYTLEMCSVPDEAVKFFLWFLLSPEPRTRALQIGYSVTPLPEAHRVVDYFLTLECAGKKLIDHEFEDQRIGNVWDAMLSIAMICTPFPILLAIGAFLKADQRRKGNLFFILCTLLGSILLLFAVILFYLVPNVDSICILRTWFVGLGFVMLVMPIVTKVIWGIYLVRQSSQFKSSYISFSRLGVPLFIAIGLQVSLLIIWAIVDPYVSTVVVTNEFFQTSHYECSSDINWIWFGIEIGFFGAFLLFAFVVYWSAGNPRLRQLHDISWMGFTIYNLLVIMVLLIPLLAGFENPEDQQYFIICIGLIFPAMFTSLTLYGPIVLPNLFKVLPNRSTTRGTSDSGSKTPPS